MESKKRERSKNFIEEEKEYLLELISRKKSIIENKKTDGTTCQQKHKAWEFVMDRYNSNAKTGPRTVQQLKLLYDNLKKTVKKRISDEKLEIYKTGGGEAKINKGCTELPQRCENMVLDLLGPSIQPLENPFDSNELEVLAQETNSDNYEEPGPSSLQKQKTGNRETNIVLYSFSSDEDTESPENDLEQPSPIRPLSPPVTQASPSIETSAPPVIKNFFEKVKEKKSKSCKGSLFQEQILEMKIEKHKKQMEILEIVKQKEMADLKLKKLEIEMKMKSLSKL